ncbi:glycosyltransferase [Acidithrix sp. C25]|uniref:glycosyltransferase family 2 protein n=1 Tax=Acidithrix sp. C25 TaxID=1671482 RepID=UPI00191BA7E3|nr:glycosyltransferase [Acidithrix sp. C25]
MVEKVTIVVPTRNSERTLRACLESIRHQSNPCTLVVVDNFSLDSSRHIALELADVVIDSGPERSAQRNIGASAAPAEILGFIDSDMICPSDLVEKVLIEVGKGAVSVTVPERTIGQGYWTEVREYERSFYLGNDAIEAPRFYRKDVFDLVGGFDESLTGPEDWDLGLRSYSEGPRSRVETVILHDEGRVRYFDACKKKAYYGVGLLRYASKHGASGIVTASRRPWLKEPSTYTSLLGLGLLALKIGEAFAVLVAISIHQFRKLSVSLQVVKRRLARGNG